MKSRALNRTIITLILLLMMSAVLTGCGKKNQKQNPEEPAPAQPVPTQEAQPAEEPEAEPTPEAAVPEELVSPIHVYVDTQGSHVDGSGDQYGLGFMERDYVVLDEESQKKVPKLAAALKDINDRHHREYQSVFTKFTKAALSYGEKMKDSWDYDSDYLEDYHYIKVYRADTEVLSYMTTKTSFWGEQRYEKYEGCTLDAQTGEEVTIQDLIADGEAFEQAIYSELQKKYGRDIILLTQNTPKLYDPERLHWVMSPEGIVIFYTSTELPSKAKKDLFVHVPFAGHEQAFRGSYQNATEAFAIPFDLERTFLMDTDGNGSLEKVEFQPVSPEGAEDAGEYSTFTITVDGVCYEDYPESWFYGCNPYYVHNRENNAIYVFQASYDRDRIAVIEFENGRPVLTGTRPNVTFQYDDADAGGTEYGYRMYEFTDPAMVNEWLSFEEQICGVYHYEASEEYRQADYEISCIGGRYYLEYMGESDYAAAELELLDSTPYGGGGELVYMVRLYPFSGFSFAGDYWGNGGAVCSFIKSGDSKLIISAAQPFSTGEELILERTDGEPIHAMPAEPNTRAEEYIGAWSASLRDGDLFAEFTEDGHANLVFKEESYPPTVYKGVYRITDSAGAGSGTIDAQRLGYGTQPGEPLYLTFENGSPMLTTEDGDSLFGVSPGALRRYGEGNAARPIVPGPADRAYELLEQWVEYTGDDSLYYDYNPDYIDYICDKAINLAGGVDCQMYPPQPNGHGGEIWIRTYQYPIGNSDESGTWVRYDLKEGNFYDLYGAELYES